MANTKKKATVKKKEPSKKEIMKQLHDPNISEAKKNKLIDLLYKGIETR